MKIPEGVSIEVAGDVIRVKANKDAGSESKLEKKFNSQLLEVRVEGSELVVKPKRKETRALRAAKNAVEAHVKNMIEGLSKNFEKKLEIVFAHFPISVEVKDKDVLIKNFLGEKIPRKARIVGDVQVIVSGNQITVKGKNKEDVGQTANNIIRATKIRARDERIFQDGIYYSQ
ncbi:MAG: 50S ribosomal protein L6 [Candidatus Norongarragalinales archaeon]